MSLTYDNNLERQLSSLFSAEAGQTHLPQGTWHELAQRMGEPDGPSIVRRLIDVLGISGWRNPMNLKYVATSVSVLVVIAIAALSFILTDSDGDTESAGTAAESTSINDDTNSGVIPADTAVTEPTPQKATAFERFDVPGQVFRLDGDTIWAAESNVGLAQYTLGGELLQTVDLIAAGAGGEYHGFVIVDDVITMVEAGPRPDWPGFVRVGTDGEIVEVAPFGTGEGDDRVEPRLIATDGTAIWIGATWNAGNRRLFLIHRIRFDVSGPREELLPFTSELSALKFIDDSFWASTQAGELLRFNADGVIIGAIETPSAATAFDFDGEHIWVTLNDAVISKLDRSGNELARFEHEDATFIGREIVHNDGFIWAMFDSPSGSQVVRLDLDAQLVSTHLDGMGVRGVQFTDDHAYFFSGYASAPRIGLMRVPLHE